MTKITVTTITREHLPGKQSRKERVFHTLEQASADIQRYIEDICEYYEWPEKWDAEEFGGQPFPTRELGAVERLRALLANSNGQPVVVWGPFSSCCLLVPEEILLTETK